MNEVKVTVEHLQRGQPRSYAPHTYESRLTFEAEKSWDTPLEEQVKDIARGLVYSFTEDPVTDENSYYRPRLVKLEQVAEEDHPRRKLRYRDVWLVRIEVPYCD